MKQIYFIISTLSLLITVNTACNDGYIEATFSGTNSIYASFYNYYAYIYRDDNNQLITYAYLYGSNTYFSNQFCILPFVRYRIQKTGTIDWMTTEQVQVAVNRIDMVGHSNYVSGSSYNTVNFMYYLFKDYSTEVKYTDSPQTDNLWTSVTYDDASWESKTPGNFPQQSTITRYYRYTYTFDSSYINENDMYAISIYSKDGYILYVNGDEQSKDGLTYPSESTTYSSKTGSSYTEYVLTIPLVSLIDENNKITIAVELHRASGTSLVNDGFKLSLYGRKKYSVHNIMNPVIASSACKKTDGVQCSTNLFNDGSIHYAAYVQIPGGVTMTISYIYKGVMSLSGYVVTGWFHDSTYQNFKIYGTVDGGVTWLYLEQISYGQLINIQDITKIFSTYSIMLNGFKIEIYCSSYCDILETRPIISAKAKNTDIAYDSKIYTGYTNSEITITPSARTITGITIAPSLPTGLSIDSTTGIISGASTVAVNGEYMITGVTSSSLYRSTKIILIIEVPTPCPEDGEWPETAADVTVTIDCPDPKNYEGSRKRECVNINNAGNWSDEINIECILKKPTITYSSNSISSPIFSEIPMNPSTITGLEYTISISPSLPDGLSFDSTTGLIYGTPTVSLDATIYTITIENTSGSNTFDITITIIQVQCAADGIEWPATNASKTVSNVCSGHFVGTITRRCSEGGEWEAVIEQCSGCFDSYYKSGNECVLCDQGTVTGDSDGNYDCTPCDASSSYIQDNVCILKKPTITYSSDTLSGTTFTPIPINPSTITGAEYTISINPSLPDGLLIDSTTGLIYGTPTVSLDTTIYTITIENTSGSNTFDITITIMNSQCAADGIEWPATNASETATNACPEPSIGTITRRCSESGEWEVVVNQCSGCFGAFYKSGNECVLCDHGVVTGDSNGNYDCTPCDASLNYIYNNECIPKDTCLAFDDEEGISWKDTFSSYYDYVTCDNDNQTGFYSRKCISENSWDTIVDKSSCQSKSEEGGVDLVHASIPIENLVSYQNEDDIDLAAARAIVQSNPYLLYEFYIAFEYPYSSVAYKTSNLHYFIYTSTSVAKEWATNNEKRFTDISTNLHSINSKIFNDKVETTYNDKFIRFENVPTCTDEYDNVLELGEYTPDQCTIEGVTSYNKYQCIQNGIKPELKSISTIKCNPDPTTKPTTTPSTTPTTTPTTKPTTPPEPITKYIKLELLLVGVDIKNIYCSSIVGLYRAVLASTDSVFYNFDINNYETTEYNGGKALKVTMFFRTAEDQFDTLKSELQSSLHQSQIFSNNLKEYASIICNNIQVTSNEIIDTVSVPETRRLRG